MHHVALDRPGPHDRDLDHQVVEVLRARAAAACSSARATRSGTRRWCRRGGSSRRPPDPPPGAAMSMVILPPRRPLTNASARRMAESIPSASTSTLSRPRLSRSSLSHWMTLRSGMAAFSIGTSCASGPREITKPPTCCDRWRGKPRRAFASAIRRRITGLAGSKPASRRRCGEVLAVVPPRDRLGDGVHLPRIEIERLADVAQRALGPVGDQRGRQRGAVAPVLFVDVLDDLLAPLVLEVDVDVGRLVALLREEALEQQFLLRRIDLGDAQGVAHGRVGRRAASLAEDAPAARERGPRRAR